jgi:propanol-preferring alcohol dehydrogenase
MTWSSITRAVSDETEGERVLRSMVNFTRQHGQDFFSLVVGHSLQTHVQPFALRDANAAVQAVRTAR